MRNLGIYLQQNKKMQFKNTINTFCQSEKNLDFNIVEGVITLEIDPIQSYIEDNANQKRQTPSTGQYNPYQNPQLVTDHQIQTQYLQKSILQKSQSQDMLSQCPEQIQQLQDSEICQESYFQEALTYQQFAQDQLQMQFRMDQEGIIKDFQCDSIFFKMNQSDSKNNISNISNEKQSLQAQQENLTTVQLNQDRNDSKNIGKGFWKAFGHFILDKKDPKIKRLLDSYFPNQQDQQNYRKFVYDNMRKPTHISLKTIKRFLLDQQFYCKANRCFGIHYLRHGFLKHIYSSKMEKRHIHLRYMGRWRQIFQCPQNFNSMK